MLEKKDKGELRLTGLKLFQTAFDFARFCAFWNSYECLGFQLFFLQPLSFMTSSARYPGHTNLTYVRDLGLRMMQCLAETMVTHFTTLCKALNV